MADLPGDVRRFVLTSIPSVPFLEAALLFHSSPQTWLGCTDLSAALYLAADRTTELLEALRAAGIVEREAQPPQRYRYGPGDPLLAQALDRLAEAYPKHLIAITKLVHGKSAHGAQRFADAFRLGKDR